MGGVKIGGGVDFDFEAAFGDLQRSVDEQNRRMREFLFGRRATSKHLFGEVQVPASVTRPLLIDLCPQGNAPGMIWKVESLRLWGDSPLTSPPGSSTPVDATSGVVANATATATMPAVAGKTNVLNALQVTGLGATAGSTVTGTITGVQGGTQEFTVAIPAGVTTPVNFELTFPGGLFATGPNTAIVVSVPAFGAGNTNAEVNTQGALQTGNTGQVGAAAFIGAPLVPYQNTDQPDNANCIAPNLAVPQLVNLPDMEIVKGTDHLYVLVGSGVAGVYAQVFCTATVLEAVDRPETLGWL